MRQLVKHLALAAIYLMGFCAFAAPPAKEIVATDQEFLLQANSCWVAHAKYCELAENRANSSRIKEFALKLSKDRAPDMEQFAVLTMRYKTPFVTGLDPEKSVICDRLTKLTGQEFDRAFIGQIIADLEKAERLFDYEAKYGSQADMKEFAERTLAKLRDQLNQAREIEVALR